METATKTVEAPASSKALAQAYLAEPGALAPLVKEAEELRKQGLVVTVTNTPEPVAFETVWENGTYLDPTKEAVQNLADAARTIGGTRRRISLTLGFHRPSAYDRALKAFDNRGKVKQSPRKATEAKAPAEPKGDIVAEQAAKQAEAPKGTRPAHKAEAAKQAG